MQHPKNRKNDSRMLVFYTRGIMLEQIIFNLQYADSQ